MNDPFVRVLQARRAYFNSRFAEKQVTHPDLDGDLFLLVLGEYVAPLVEAVAQVNADAALVVGQYLYDLALDLFAQGLITVAGVTHAVWRELLPALAPFLVHQPQRVAASVINAAYNISATPDARPQEWIAIMRRAVPLCAEVDVLLCAGQVAAWRAGMAHYRPGALELLKTLDAPLARTIFGLDANALAPDTGALCEALLSNPWHDPANASSGERALQLVRRVGAFRGFGGSFLTPPRVVWTGAGFVATDEQESYLIHADAFGATLHRTGESKMQRVSSPFQLSPAGEVTREELKTTFPVLAKATSSAANQNTLAVTTEFTHSIFFIAVIE